MQYENYLDMAYPFAKKISVHICVMIVTSTGLLEHEEKNEVDLRENSLMKLAVDVLLTSTEQYMWAGSWIETDAA